VTTWVVYGRVPAVLKKGCRHYPKLILSQIERSQAVTSLASDNARVRYLEAESLLTFAI